MTTNSPTVLLTASQLVVGSTSGGRRKTVSASVDIAVCSSVHPSVCHTHTPTSSSSHLFARLQILAFNAYIVCNTLVSKETDLWGRIFTKDRFY